MTKINFANMMWSSVDQNKFYVLYLICICSFVSNYARSFIFFLHNYNLSMYHQKFNGYVFTIIKNKAYV